MLPLSADLAEAEALASRSWLSWLLTPRVLYGAHSATIVLPFGGGRALRLPLREAPARAVVAAAQALLALLLAAFVWWWWCGRRGAATVTSAMAEEVSSHPLGPLQARAGAARAGAAVAGAARAGAAAAGASGLVNPLRRRAALTTKR